VPGARPGSELREPHSGGSEGDAHPGGSGGDARFAERGHPLPAGFPPADGVLDRSLSLVRYLRDHCPWDREQTAESLVPHLLEETHETVDAIHADDAEALRGELGDLLLNLAFQIVVGEEGGRFTREEVMSGLERKMVRRHPHLFGGEPERWEVIKAKERADSRGEPGERPGSPGGTLEGLARGMDPLLRAHRIQERVAGVGFDWDEAEGALAKVREEIAEVESALAGHDAGALSEELGDLLFAVVNLARLSGGHAVPALATANAKFQRRFKALEELARDRDVPIPGASLEELDLLWDEVKRRERGAGPPDGDAQ